MTRVNLPNYREAIIYKVAKSEIKKIDFAQCAQPTQTLGQYYNQAKVKPDLLVNGGLFNMSDGTTCFNMIDEGKKRAESMKGKEGFGIIDEATILFGNVNSRTDWRDFISGYPVLIENNHFAPITEALELDYNARRTILGENYDNLYFVVVESPGYSFKKMQQLMYDLGCRFAINLDGGGSSRMLVGGKCVTSAICNRSVDNVVAVYLKKYLYRVQLGAFGSKSNAEKFRDEVAKLPGFDGMDYKSAYVRLVNGLYKVQVGAFSNKENANKVKYDLDKKGYSAFIAAEEQN